MAALLAVVACGGVSDRQPSTGEHSGDVGSAGKQTDEASPSSESGTAGTAPGSVGEIGAGTGGSAALDPGSGGSTGGVGGSGLPKRGPYDDLGVFAPPQDCHFSGAGTCCTYQFCLDVEDTTKVFPQSGAGGAPSEIADVCHTADTRVGFCGEIRTLPTVQDGKCCFTVNSGDCC